MTSTQILFLIAIVYVLFYIAPLPLYGSVSSHWAWRKGYPYGPWFLIAIFLGPLTFLVVLCLPKRTILNRPAKSKNNWTCPDCWQVNESWDTHCTNCGREKPESKVK